MGVYISILKPQAPPKKKNFFIFHDKAPTVSIFFFFFLVLLPSLYIYMYMYM